MLNIDYDELEAAFYWVSASAPFDNAAYISKTSGKVFYASSSHDMEEELPDDYEDAALYWAAPHKFDLDLGRELAFRFTDASLPNRRREVNDIFHHRGAYAHFKSLLVRHQLLEAWFAYEREATEAALLAWASQLGMIVRPRQRGKCA